MAGVIETDMVIAALLLLAGVIASQAASRFGIPALLLFLVLGMLAGSEGLGGIYFDNAFLAQALGVLALSLILFSGGLDTDWPGVRQVLKEGITLATTGVVISALVMGVLAGAVLGFSLIDGLLLGAIVASTDAAAVFAVLRSKSVGLKGKLKPLLELEAGINDPMAVILTTAIIQFATHPQTPPGAFLVRFVQQAVLGGAIGYVMGKLIPTVANRLKLAYEGLYPVFTLALVVLTYGVATFVGGSGFLAVYLAGLVAGNHEFVHRRSLLRFHDGLAWLMQIAMFMTLGLLEFPSQLLPIAGRALIVTALLMFVARPLSVFISLAPFHVGTREKLLVSWVGLRGAVPIVLATYPLLAGLPNALLIFNVVFFVVFVSTLLQGASIPTVARWLGVNAPLPPQWEQPLEFNPVRGLKSTLREVILPAESDAAGKRIMDLKLPQTFLVILVGRDKHFILPSGTTTLQAHDRLLVLADQESFRCAQWRLVTPLADRGGPAEEEAVCPPGLMWEEASLEPVEAPVVSTEPLLEPLRALSEPAQASLEQVRSPVESAPSPIEPGRSATHSASPFASGEEGGLGPGLDQATPGDPVT